MKLFTWSDILNRVNMKQALKPSRQNQNSDMTFETRISHKQRQ